MSMFSHIEELIRRLEARIEALESPAPAPAPVAEKPVTAAGQAGAAPEKN